MSLIINCENNAILWVDDTGPDDTGPAARTCHVRDVTSYTSSRVRCVTSLVTQVTDRTKNGVQTPYSLRKQRRDGKIFDGKLIVG